MNDVKMNTSDLGVKTSSARSVSHSVSNPNPGKTEKNADELIQSNQKVNESQREQEQQNQQQVKEAVARLNDYVQTIQRNLQFNLDEDSGKTIITVVDRNTSEIVRQIPDDVALKLAQDLQQEEPLSLFNAKV